MAQAFQTGLPPPPPAPGPGACSCVNRAFEVHTPQLTGQQPLGSSPLRLSQEIRKGLWKLVLPERREKENDRVLDENMGGIYPNSWSSSISKDSSPLLLPLSPCGSSRTVSWFVFNLTQACANWCFRGFNRQYVDSMLWYWRFCQIWKELPNHRNMNICAVVYECRVSLNTFVSSGGPGILPFGIDFVLSSGGYFAGAWRFHHIILFLNLHVRPWEVCCFNPYFANEKSSGRLKLAGITQLADSIAGILNCSALKPMFWTSALCNWESESCWPASFLFCPCYSHSKP